MKIKLDVEKIKEVFLEYERLNSLPINEVELYENGKPLEISQEVIEEWRFVGLGLVYFVMSNEYKKT